MKLQTVTLECIEDEHGLIGLIVQGMPVNEETNASTEGLLIAHDLIEHINGVQNIGSIWDEMQALGALWYCRGQWSDLRRGGRGSIYTPHESVAAEFTRMFHDFAYGANLPGKIPRTMPHDSDSDFLQIIEHADEEYNSEINPGEFTPADLEALKQKFNRAALSGLRIGYRKAASKYGKHGRFFGNSLFWKVAEEVQQVCKHMEQGQTFQLRYGMKDGQAWAQCREVYPEDF
jgi:hypothetical protein